MSTDPSSWRRRLTNTYLDGWVADCLCIECDVCTMADLVWLWHVYKTRGAPAAPLKYVPYVFWDLDTWDYLNETLEYHAKWLAPDARADYDAFLGRMTVLDLWKHYEPKAAARRSKRQRADEMLPLFAEEGKA